MQIQDFNNKKNAVKFQRGAAAIEFSLVFLIFFTLFYAMVSYAIIFLLKTSFHHAANEGARSAISVDHQSFANDGAYGAALEDRVRETVGNSLQWLPNKARNLVLGTGNSNVVANYDIGNKILTVRVLYPNYVGNPLIPLLTLPGIGAMYSSPADLQGSAIMRMF